MKNAVGVAIATEAQILSVERFSREFGNALNALRGELHLNMRGLARATNNSLAWISYLERGQRVPTWSTVQSLSSFFKEHGACKKQVAAMETAARKMLLARTFKDL